MIRRLICCIPVLLIAARILAIDASVAHTLFFLPDSSAGGRLSPNVELYWQVNPHTVHFKTNADKKIAAKIRTDIVFTNDEGVLAEDHFILQTTPRSNPDDLATISILEGRHYFVTSGMIWIRFKLTDIDDSSNKFAYSDSFIVSRPESGPYYSGVQLLDTIVQSPVKTPFTKNGHQQVPLCANFLNEDKMVLHYYAELYGANQLPASDFPLTQKVTIGKKENAVTINNFLRIDTLSADRRAAVSGSFPINTLGSGNYYVNMSVETKTHKVVATGSLFFQRMNQHPVKDTEVARKGPVNDTGMESVTYLNMDKTFLIKYNLQQIKAILKMLIPTSDEMGVSTINNFLKKPDEIYMRYYIYNYFLAIDKKDPARAWKEFSAKIMEVNKKFNFQSTPGYETERGIIYLRYGPPTDIITVNNETGTLPYEIWQYNVLTQMNKKQVADAVFLFYKPDQMLGDYRLLHSTVSGEIYNTGWRTYLYTSANTGVNTSTRAEDYMGPNR